MRTCKEKAIEWGISERAVSDLCKKGKVYGAVKIKRVWQIPDDAKKPVDSRLSSGKFVKKNEKLIRKTLPIGISDYIFLFGSI